MKKIILFLNIFSITLFSPMIALAHGGHEQGIKPWLMGLWYTIRLKYWDRLIWLLVAFMAGLGLFLLIQQLKSKKSR